MQSDPYLSGYFAVQNSYYCPLRLKKYLSTFRILYTSASITFLFSLYNHHNNQSGSLNVFAEKIYFLTTYSRFFHS